jgi:hydrogenase nickel incorporation protein HypB
MSNVNEKLVQLEIDVLNENNLTAEENRRFFKENNILALNLVSSPGSGKTTLLCRTVSELKSRFSVSVIEGDQETINDAERIRATGVDAIQINTGEGCHLDAAMIKNALTKFPDLSDSVLFIENVGNLVCPASFDLGEFCKVAVLSVTEGEDKPIKYPYMFAASKVMIINKTDLLPYVDFSVDRCIDYARRVNPSIEVFLLSATKGDGMQEWCSWIAGHTAKRD